MIKYDNTYEDDRETDLQFKKLREYLGKNTLECQIEADCILTGLTTLDLKEWFDYCKEHYENSTKKCYRDAMKRIYQIAKDRKMVIEANSTPVARYVVDIKNKRMNWPIAIRGSRFTWDYSN